MTPAVTRLRALLADHLVATAYRIAPAHVERVYRVKITTEPAPAPAPARRARPRRRGEHARSRL